MKTEPELIPDGGITSPRGFLAGAVSAGIKDRSRSRLDLGILFSERSCAAAAVFTQNLVKAAPVLLDQERLSNGRVQAVVMNSGCANSSTGKQGMEDAVAMADMAARRTGAAPEETLVASTGLIGSCLPMDSIREGISQVRLTVEGGHDLARAIMTTDTVPKEVAVKAGGFTIGGMAKGSGMIHPDMATMLCFLATDAGVDGSLLKLALKEAVDKSLNMVSIDGDNSTNDMALLMANGMAGGERITAGSPQAAVFQVALNDVCIRLARALARDGEGATKMIEVTVKGAATMDDARKVARTVVSSSLVKAAVHGADPNWGRVLAAVGRSGADIDPDKLELEIGGVRLVKAGNPVTYNGGKVVRHLSGEDISIILTLNMGGAEATAWGCDLSEEYVTINADYTT